MSTELVPCPASVPSCVVHADAEGCQARGLNVHAAAKVTTALERVADGNLSNVKAVGSGVLESKIDFGPGYRIYFGRDGDRLIILLAGGTKKRQQEDIRQAKTNWEDYRKRKS